MNQNQNDPRYTMLHKLWREASFKRPTHTFLDGSIAVFVPSLKLEKIGEEIELYNTDSEMYRIVPIHQLSYAFENGLDALSDSICYSNCLRKQKQKNIIDKRNAYETVTKRVLGYEELGILNLKEIKNHYEELHTTDSGTD